MSYTEIKIPENTKVMVTGGAGFIGSNLCDALISLGAKVICFDNFSNGKMENIRHLLNNKNFVLIKDDINNFDKLLEASKGIDYIFHEAAWGSVPRSISMPQFYEINNVSGTLNVFEAAKRNNVKKVIYASSSSVYGNNFASKILVDLVQSFGIYGVNGWGWEDGAFKENRKASAFKLKSLNMTLSHDLHDWAFNMTWKFEPKLVEGAYNFTPNITIGVVWNPMSSIKTNLSYEYKKDEDGNYDDIWTLK